MLMEIGLKCTGILRTDDNHAGLPFFKFSEILAQLRHVPLAEWSDKMENTYPAGTKYTLKRSEIWPVFCPFRGRALASPLTTRVIRTVTTKEICRVISFIFPLP